MRNRLLLAALLSTALACGGLIDTDQMIADGEAAMAEGTAFGASTNQDGCIDEGLRKQTSCGELEVMCQAMNGVWVLGCLEAASPVAGFCDGVPRTDDIMETATWRVERCNAAGYGEDGRCQHIFASVQEHCHPE